MTGCEVSILSSTSQLLSLVVLRSSDHEFLPAFYNPNWNISKPSQLSDSSLLKISVLYFIGQEWSSFLAGMLAVTEKETANGSLEIGKMEYEVSVVVQTMPSEFVMPLLTSLVQWQPSCLPSWISFHSHPKGMLERTYEAVEFLDHPQWL